MPNEDNDEFVNVPVPRQHVTAVYALIVRLESANGPAEAESSNGAPGAALTEGLVKRMYGESWQPHQDLLTHLADHRGEWLTTSEIAEALGLPYGAKSLAGSMGAFGRRAHHRYGGLRPWETEWNPALEQAQHRMSPEVASWVKEVAAS
jgi:hypothetical protein